jgi:glycosyltransferase involved in cell wall biosynthesis
MRILHVGKYYHPRRGGMETALRTMAEGLAARGAEVCVIAAGDDGDRVQYLGGVRVVRVWTPAVANSQPLIPTLAGILRRELVRLRPDVVTLHLPNPLAALSWLAVGSAAAQGAVLTAWHHADITRQRLGRLAAAPVQRACLRRASAIGVSSSRLIRHSRELAAHRERAVAIPFGIDGTPLHSLPGAGPGPFLFVGRIVRYKGLGVLLQALAEVPEARLEVVGDGQDRRGLEALAGDLGLGGRVAWRGTLGDEDLRRAMAGARGLVLPSLDASETFGLVQLEAMAAGLPVIVSDLPTGVLDPADPASHLLVAPGDAGALAAALGRLQADPDLARAMGARGRERQRLEFGSERMIDGLAAWYETAVRAGARG